MSAPFPLCLIPNFFFLENDEEAGDDLEEARILSEWVWSNFHIWKYIFAIYNFIFGTEQFKWNFRLLPPGHIHLGEGVPANGRELEQDNF